MKLIEKKQVTGMNIHYMRYSLDYFLAAQERAGFESIELWSGIPHFFMDSVSYEDVKVLKKKIADHNLTARVFTPENCTYQYQLAAKKPTAFEKSKAYFENAIKVTAELGCPIMACNSGWGYLDETRQEAWDRSVEMISLLCDVAKKEGIILGMESLRPEETNLGLHLGDIKKMREEINQDNLKILVDVTAMGVNGETLEEWFEEFGDDIVHMHFIDGTPYGHLIWGDGCRNLEEDLKVLKKYNYKGYLGQEITDGRYYKDPLTHDIRNMKAFEPYF